MVPYAARPPVGGVAVTGVAVGVLSTAASALILLLGIGTLGAGADASGLVGPLLVAAIATGSVAMACGFALFLRKRIEWVGGSVLAVLGATLGGIGAIGGVVVFLVFFSSPSPSSSPPPLFGAHSMTSTSTGPSVR